MINWENYIYKFRGSTAPLSFWAPKVSQQEIKLIPSNSPPRAVRDPSGVGRDITCTKLRKCVSFVPGVGSKRKHVVNWIESCSPETYSRFSMARVCGRLLGRKRLARQLEILHRKFQRVFDQLVRALIVKTAYIDSWGKLGSIEVWYVYSNTSACII